ncbi:hypothetical protein [Crateriforma conspicua]|uniref:Uncharacterized protein n=1 Tax=Crateriforma conspicua TaxID=2527996 RepID=A0A5C5Y203_9PLAN|nr:hypothetical protein [Crateriforma conspicua]TWT68683.1 hypothetical protein Pan14r_09300 [Crateriforma conspicua]
MTYARARLLLGMSGVGLIVVLSTILLLTQYPLEVLPDSQSWSGGDLTALVLLFGCLAAVLFPMDLLGGFLLPNHWRPNTISLKKFAAGWFRGVLVQGTLFVAASLLILLTGRWFGTAGAVVAIAGFAILLVGVQLPIAKFVGALRSRAADDGEIDAKLEKARSIVAAWGWKPRPTTTLQHCDPGFTGGIVGLPGMETVVLPADTIRKLSPDQLAIVIARRLEAIQSGSRTRGLLLALGWVVVGFALSTSLPAAGVTSVAGLTMTCLGFTLWTFFGLLTLPTLSRQASYAIDGKVLLSGVSPEILQQTVKTLDVLQDDEPRRSALIETIFHPVPSVDNRRSPTPSGVPIAWHAARITLFVSWACMGMLVRAVHCNVGRPELWVLLPTD